MTSKKLYWKLSKLNLRKRVSYLVICFMIGFILLPVNIYFQCRLMVHERFVGAPDILVQLLAEGDGLHILLTYLMAVVFAITGSAWNNSRKKNDFYRSLPVKEKTRFTYIHVNSYLCFVAAFGVNLLISNLIVAMFGLYSASMPLATLYSLLVHSLEFGAVYFLAVIAQYLTGNSTLALMGTLVLSGVEPLIRFLMYGLKTSFYETYYYMGRDLFDKITDCITCPVAGSFECYFLVADRPSHFNEASNYLYTWPGIIRMLLQIAVFAFIAYRINKVRPAHAGNSNIVFGVTKPFIKCLIMIPVGLATTLFFYENADREIGAALFGMLCIIIISHIVLQLIIEGYFMAVKKGIRSSFIALGIMLVAFGGTYVSADRYDRYLPNPEEVESIGIALGNEYMYNIYSDDGNRLAYRQSSSFFVEDVEVRDKVLIDMVLNRLGECIDSNMCGRALEKERMNSWDSVNAMSIAFNLKDGKKVLRSYRLPKEVLADVRFALYDSQDYREATNQLTVGDNSELLENAKKVDIVYHNFGFNEYDLCGIERAADKKAMLTALAKDHNRRTAEIYKTKVPIGTVEINAMVYYQGDILLEMPVYDTDEETLAVMAGLGYVPQRFDSSEITQIEIERQIIDYAYDGVAYNSTDRVVLTPGDEMFDYIADNIELSVAADANSARDYICNYEYYITIFNENGLSVSASVMYGADADKINKLF